MRNKKNSTPMYDTKNSTREEDIMLIQELKNNENSGNYEITAEILKTEDNI